YVRVDFGKRQLTLMQPSAEVRQHGLDPRRLDPSSLARLKDELFTRHLHLLEIDRNQGDQLTCELQHFVQCVQMGTTPRVSCVDRGNAIELPHRILNCMRFNRWASKADSQTGPTHLPAPLGPLFVPAEKQAAA